MPAARIGFAVAAALVAFTQVTAVAPARADPTATVKVRTPRMIDANLNSGQDGWYNAGDRVTLVCWKRGQPVKGVNLWYRTSDNHYVADANIETGTRQPVGADCGSLDSGRAMGDRQLKNSGYGGQCTWGALQKWYENTGYYPALDGNAVDWANSARAHHWTVVDEAQPRAIVVFPPDLPGVSADGHVAWVNSVSQRFDGRWINITEMNNSTYGGLGAWWTRDVKDVPGMSYILAP